MKKKDEMMADKRLKELGVTPRIYHFEKDIGPFTAISIADDRLTWAGARAAVNQALLHLEQVPSFFPATQLIKRLHEHDYIFGLTVCDRRDYFNRQRGRTIAKGRLAKHLKQKEVK
jgi:hypothetical protein